jgi:predicted acylesterase/phospholipase RssA
MPTRRKCDIVMQGGVTSGVVYPGLVCELAKQYDFQSIGGTSAGAIAASLTAAAEYARRKGNEKAFDALAGIPKWLGENSKFGQGSNLFALFQPQPETKGLFEFAVAFLVKSWSKRILSWLSLFWIEILVGIIPGLILGYLASDVAGWRFVLTVFLTVLVCIAGVTVTAAVGITLRLGKLPHCSFGLCTGFAPSDPKKPLALVSWLNGKTNEIAGKPSNEPLTFGDLKGVDGPDQPGITLQMMTTCLTWGRPFTLPFQTHIFYFSPPEFRKFFPEEVVAWLETHPPKRHDKEAAQRPRDTIDTTGLLPLPDEDDLPVIVAARLSLSFPFLFCTVPLYAVDFTLRQSAEPQAAAPPGSVPKPRRPEHVWFTDGGICNNFPLHLFDAPVPTWPTFGVALTDRRPDRPDTRTWIPTHNNSGIQPEWTRFDAERGLSGTFGLVFAIINAARNWVNSLQAAAPGYRDRVVHIALAKDEGGLDLIMPPELVKNLNDYGVEAGKKLIDHFIHGTDEGEPIETTWDNQRWVRYRSLMALLEKFLPQFAHVLTHPQAGDVPYSDLIKRQPHEPPSTGYRLTSAQVPIAISETEKLVKVGNDLSEALQEGTPRPEPALVIRPKF